MPDYCMCKDDICPQHKTCWRFNAKPHLMQTYFFESPREGDECKYYWRMDEKEGK